MEQRENYDVLRLIEHGSICYVSSEYVTGSQLIYWLKYHPNIAKEKLYEWIHELVRLLRLIHRCRGNPCYRYVNPYCVIVTDEEKLFFLDLEAKSNKELLRQMQRRSIREHFLPPEEPYYQKSSVDLDIYGLGRTIQYLLSSVNPEPAMTRKEEARFLKFISKCLKRTSKSTSKKVSDIQRYVPVYKPKKQKRTINKKLVVLMVAVICIAAASVVIFSEPEQEQKSSPTEEESEENTQVSTSERIYQELALVYILELDQSEKGLECLKEAASGKDNLTNDLLVITETMINQRQKNSADVQEHLKHMEVVMPEQEQDLYYWFLVKGYRALGDKSSEINREILRLGKECLKSLGNSETESLENVYDETAGKCGNEIREAMAAAYEQLEQFEDSANMYEELLQRISEDGRREELYRKIILLYEEDEQSDMAMDTCTQAIEEYEDSIEFRVMYVRMLCENPAVDEEMCMQTIKEYVGQIPEILENEEFRKLQKEYGIQVEGEKVWIEK